MSTRGWIGVDLDGTLAQYDNIWRGVKHIGEPVPLMVKRVKELLSEGKEVRIFTARVYDKETRQEAVAAIQEWCLKHLQCALPVTCSKDPGMIDLYDDRCHQIMPNTGMTTAEYLAFCRNPEIR